MDEKILLAALEHLPLGRVAFFESVGSTNDVAAEWAEEGAPDFSVVFANEQTAGRGRAGRHWLTPRASALALSITLSPAALPISDLSLVTGLGALAAAETLESLYGLNPRIKWPNDVLLNGCKVAGVLAEAHWVGADLRALILGIGMNVAPASVPPPALLALQATCVEAETGRPCDRYRLAAATLEGLLRWRSHLGQPLFVAAWEERLAYRGEMVTLLAGAEEAQGRLLGLESDGRLRLETAPGEVRLTPAGEIRLRPQVDRGLK